MTTRGYWWGFRALCGLVDRSCNRIGNPPPYLRHCMSRRSMQGVGVFCGARARTLYRRSDFPFRQRQPSTHSPLRGARGTWTHTVRKTHTAHTSRLEWRRCSWRPCEQRGSAQRGRCAVPLRTVAAPPGIAPRATVTRRSVLRRAPARRKRGNSTSWFRDTKGAWCGARLVYAWALGGANSLRTNVSRC